MRARITFLTALIAATILISPFRRNLYVGDEAKYAQVIREMRQTGSLLVPVLEGEPYSHKPPIHFWMMYLLSVPFGLDSVWPYVIPSMLAFIGLLVLIRHFGAEIVGRDAAVMAGFLFSTFLLTWGVAQTARMDISFAALISMAVFFLYRLYAGAGAVNLLYAAAATGFAILVKGPMAIVVVLALLAGERYRRGRWPGGNYLAAFLLCAAIPLLWVIPATLSGGEAYTEELLIKQNVGRAIGSWVHSEPPWFYLLRFPLTFLPWCALGVIAILALYRRPRPDPDDDPRDDPRRFCVTWILAVLVPFSLLSGKLDVYMIPAMVPFALLAGRFVTEAVEDRWTWRGVAANRYLLGFLALISAAGLVAFPRFVEKTPEIESLEQFGGASAMMLLAIIATGGALAWHFARHSLSLQESTLVTGVAVLFPLIAAVTYFLPLSNELSSPAPLVSRIAAQNVPGESVALFACPHLWSKDFPPTLSRVRYLGRKGLIVPGQPPPLVVAARVSRIGELGPEFVRDYVKVDEVRLKRKEFGVYRRR